MISVGFCIVKNTPIILKNKNNLIITKKLIMLKQFNVYKEFDIPNIS